MDRIKSFKDPIYGYITVPQKYIDNIIDKAVFQRLRRIIQTSYAPLYSSAMHNRFVHSLGVYHLGCLAFKQIENENKIHSFAEHGYLEKIGNVFKLACLLHDVGHAPFSHTGELFYLGQNEKYDVIHKKLEECVKSSDFSTPSTGSQAAAPHEIMSAIIGLEEFSDCLPMNNGDNRSFFARCITGYSYTDGSWESQIKNCFISLLNSKIIDVDKLDYLIRDAFITGFDTVNIDYVRLISSLTIVDGGSGYHIAYNKSALSVIENVVYAHDAERKWIQNHPIVVYEGYLVYHMIRYLNEKINSDGKKLFSMESLSSTGQLFKENIKIRLISDDDIVYLAKNVYTSDLGNEYFERASRRHPAWKSEAEYKVAFLGAIGSGDVLKQFEDSMENIGNYLRRNSRNGVIDDELLENLKNDMPSQRDLDLLGSIGDKIVNTQNKDKNGMLKIFTKLQEYAKKNDIPFSFVILTASQFNSSFGKPDFANIDIVFKTSPPKTSIKKFSEVASSLEAKASQRDKFFYLFYKRNIDNPIGIDCEEISRMLFSSILSVNS